MSSQKTPLNPQFLGNLQQLLPAEQIKSESADRWSYGYDNSRQHTPPDLVLFPESDKQVSAIISLCNDHGVPVTARGHGTCTTGAAVPLQGGVVLSFERMDQILEIDPANRLMVVQPGVTNQAVQEAAGEHGFFWAPDPTSKSICTIGGNLACNAAGPRAVKYGTTRENVLGLRAVTGSGEEIVCGVRTSKGVVGYDLTRLIIGSEGTLAIVTEATLKLTPLAETKRTLRLIYRDVESAAEAVVAIMSQPVTPCALEFMDGKAIEMIRSHAGNLLPEEAGSLLMIEVDGALSCIDEATTGVITAAQNSGCIDFSIAQTDEQVEQLWAVRRALSPALRTVAPKKINEDVVVPVSHIPELITQLQLLAEKYAITIVNFGHAGNGNVHVNLLIDPDDKNQMSAADACLKELFNLVIRLNGTLSGEHGIGLVKRDYVDLELDPVALKLMRKIKQQFDPNHILNSGKTLPNM